MAVSVLLFLPAIGALIYFQFGIQLDEAPDDGRADVLDWRLLIINLHKPILAPICRRLDRCDTGWFLRLAGLVLFLGIERDFHLIFCL